jgi:hypothetical protein
LEDLADGLELDGLQAFTFGAVEIADLEGEP